MQIGRLIIFVLVGVFLAGCAFEALAKAPVRSGNSTDLTAARPTILPPSPSPTAIVCTQNPPNLSVRVALGLKTTRRNQLYQDIVVEGHGFLQGEKVDLVLNGYSDTGSGSRIEAGRHVDTEGNFAYEDSLPLDEPNMRWRVVVVHQRGAACADFMTN